MPGFKLPSPIFRVAAASITRGRVSAATVAEPGEAGVAAEMDGEVAAETARREGIVRVRAETTKVAAGNCPYVPPS